VNLWFNPETQSDLDYAREELEHAYDNIANGCLRDMVDLGAIDWEELADHLEEEEEEDAA
jgi:hypothetical protein